MKAVSFLHQKGGTGKSTLSLSLALALAARGERLLLVDADPQATAIEWGNRYGEPFGIEMESHPLPDLPDHLARWGQAADWLIVDGPPSLSPLTESILRASAQVVIPVRPSQPDVWALTWIAALVRKLQREGLPLVARVVFNLYRGEELGPLQAGVERLGLPLHGEPIPADPGFAAIFTGAPLPDGLHQRVLALVD